MSVYTNLEEMTSSLEISTDLHPANGRSMHKVGNILDFYRCSTSGRPPLRVGLMLDSIRTTRVQAAIIEAIQQTNFAKIELILLNKKAPPVVRDSRQTFLPGKILGRLTNPKLRSSLLYDFYTRLNSKQSVPSDPTVAADCSSLLQCTPRIEIQPLGKGFVHRFAPEAVKEIRSRNLDVLIRFGFNILRGDILSSAKYGVWSYHHGDNEFYRGAPALFWEIYEQNSISGVILQVLTEELDNGLVLCKGLYPTANSLWVVKNRLRPYWGSVYFLPMKLYELHQYGWDHVRGRSIPQAPYQGKQKVYRSPANSAMLRWLGPVMMKKLISRPFHRDKVAHWKIALRVGGEPLYRKIGKPDMTGFRWIEPPRGHFYADPFLIKEDRVWLFFEDYLYAESRAAISVAEVRPDGSLGPVERCLDRPYHLSFPFVFQDRGEFYMVPESSGSGAIELYRAARFPYEWKLERVLLKGKFVDTTLYRRSGLWWLLTSASSAPEGANPLLLFSSKTLDGPWQFHISNPISTDVRFCRNGGRMFEHENKLLRWSQSGVPTYGGSLSLNEIEVLTPEEYREREVLRIEPSWSAGLIGTHAYDHVGQVEAIDGCVRSARIKHRK